MDELEQRIAARLNEALKQAEAARIDPGRPLDEGLASGADGYADYVLSIEDVARIAAQEARATR